MAQAKRVRILQIFYDAATRETLDPAFEPLDNTGNERPDWSEYWPIRQALTAHPFADDDYLGFFSPRFRVKTGLTGESVLAAIAGKHAEVYSFSPYFEQAALYRSPFEQGEVAHPGLMAAVSELMPVLGLPLDPRTMVCDQTTTVFANFFVAKYTLWRAWFTLAEQLFAFCEKAEHPLAQQLVSLTSHRHEHYPMKVFVMERLITLLLEARGLHATYCVDIMTAPRSLPSVDSVLGPMLVLDALKGQYRATGNALYLEQFNQLLHSVLGVLSKIWAQPQAQVQAPARGSQ